MRSDEGLDQQYSLPLLVEGGQEVYYSSEDEQEGVGVSRTVIKQNQ